MCISERETSLMFIFLGLCTSKCFDLYCRVLKEGNVCVLVFVGNEFDGADMKKTGRCRVFRIC